MRCRGSPPSGHDGSSNRVGVSPIGPLLSQHPRRLQEVVTVASRATQSFRLLWTPSARYPCIQISDAEPAIDEQPEELHQHVAVQNAPARRVLQLLLYTPVNEHLVRGVGSAGGHLEMLRECIAGR